jgi:nitroreductase
VVDPSENEGSWRSEPDPVRRLVAAAVRAPSSHNTQPWLFEIEDSRVDLIADRTRALPVNDPDDRELTISCGAALFNLRAAAAAEGMETRVVPFPDGADGDLLASVTVVPGEPGTEGRLAGAIESRHTLRESFSDHEQSGPLAERLVQAAEAEGTWLEIVGDHGTRDAIASLVAEGDRIQFADPRWRRELASWMHQRRKGDGMAAFGLATPVVRLVVSGFDLGKSTAGKDSALASEAPALAVLGTGSDSPQDRLAAGQALQRVLLEAAGEGVQAGYLNQPCQVGELRPRLAEALGSTGVPQLVLRLGRPEGEPEHSARRPLGEVLV